MDDYQFELHGVKFKYRDGSVFRYWDYKTKRNKAWKIVNTIKRKDHLYFEFTTKKNNIHILYLSNKHQIPFQVHTPTNPAHVLRRTACSFPLRVNKSFIYWTYYHLQILVFYFFLYF